MSIDLGYLVFDCPESWFVMVGSKNDSEVAIFGQDQTRIELRIYSAEQNNPRDSLKRFYLDLLNNLRKKNFHVDDLVEEHDFEILAENPTSKDKVSFIQYFLGIKGNIIMEFKLLDGLEEHPRLIRNMIKDCRLGILNNTFLPFTSLAFFPQGENWNKFGGQLICSSN